MFLYRVEIEWPEGNDGWDSMEYRVVAHGWMSAGMSARAMYDAQGLDNRGDVVCIERLEKVDAIPEGAAQ